FACARWFVVCARVGRLLSLAWADGEVAWGREGYLCRSRTAAVGSSSSARRPGASSSGPGSWMSAIARPAGRTSTIATRWRRSKSTGGQVTAFASRRGVRMKTSPCTLESPVAQHDPGNHALQQTGHATDGKSRYDVKPAWAGC